MEEDAILKTRLQIEERLLKRFVRRTLSFIKDSNNSNNSNDNGEVEVIEMIAAELAQYEVSLRKAVQMYKVNLEEIQQYEQMRQECQSRIESCTRDIEALTAQLAHERQIRQNKEEYNRMAQQIMLLPPRFQLEASVEEILQETEQLGTLERQIQTVIGEERMAIAGQLEGLVGCLGSIDAQVAHFTLNIKK